MKFISRFFRRSDAAELYVEQVEKDLSSLICFSALALCMIGILAVYSLSVPIADTFIFNTVSLRHILSIFIAVVVLIALCFIHSKNYQKLILLFEIVSILLLVLVQLFGQEINGAKRWLNFLPVSFQPSELCKVLLIISLSARLAKVNNISKNKVAVCKALIPAGICSVLLLLQPDFGAFALLLMCIVLMLFLAGLATKYFVVLGSISIGLFAYLITSAGYRMKRFMAFWDPSLDPYGAAFQPLQALVAIKNAKWMDLSGMGKGQQKDFYLRDIHTDYIFAGTVEDLGVVFGVLILVASFLLTTCFFKIAIRLERQADRFGYLLVATIGGMYALQTVFHIGVSLGLLPPKGITLPLVSFGGSSLVVSALIVGILLRFERESRSRTSVRVSEVHNHNVRREGFANVT